MQNCAHSTKPKGDFEDKFLVNLERSVANPKCYTAMRMANQGHLYCSKKLDYVIDVQLDEAKTKNYCVTKHHL